MKRNFRLFLSLLPLLAPAAHAQFIYTTNNGAITITDYIGPPYAVTIPGTINGLPVTAIGAYAFSEDGVTDVTIPDSVSSIEASAFQYSYALGSVTIPNSVTNIGAYAFENCSGMTNLIIPGSVVDIGDYAFEYCDILTTVTLGAGVSIIGDGAFTECNRLANISVPNSVLSIGDDALSECYDLGSAIIGISVTNIGCDAFGSCGGLTNVVIGGSVAAIGNEAFFGCGKLANIAIPKSVTSIGSYSFAQSGLTNVTIPGSVNSISNDAFFDCEYLTGATIGEGVRTIGYGAFENSGLTSVNLPNTLTNIADLLFLGSSLTNVTIPDSVVSIGSEAFENCYVLTNVAIGNGVTSIGLYAFDECPNLATVTVGAGVTNLAASAFGTVDSFGDEIYTSTNRIDFYFLGNAPSATASFERDTNVTLYYLTGAAGWGQTLAGVPAVALNSLSFTASSTNGAVPFTVNFTSTGVDTAGNAIAAWRWTFGDGSTSAERNPSHTYTAAGAFHPALFATNSGGNTVVGTGPSTIIALSAASTNLIFGGVSLAGSSLLLTGLNGVMGQTYYVLAATNLNQPLSQWIPVATNVPTTNGSFLITLNNTVSSAAAQRFYIIEEK